MAGDLVTLVLATLEGLTIGVVFVLVLLGGFCFLFGLPKLRATGRGTGVSRSLDELVGQPTGFLPPDTPRGTMDQLAAGTSHASRS